MILTDKLNLYREDMDDEIKEICGEIVKQAFIDNVDVPSKVIIRCNDKIDTLKLDKFLNKVNLSIIDSIRFMDSKTGYKYIEIKIEEI